MKSAAVFVLVAFFALLCCVSCVQAQTNCREFEFDVYNILNGFTAFQLAQISTPGDGNGVSFAGMTIPVTLATGITNSLVEFQIILAPNVGVVDTLFPNGSIIPVQYTIIPNSIELSLNGLSITQDYNPKGNNFTFNTFSASSAMNANVLNISIIQNATTPGATSTCTTQYAFNITNPQTSVVGDPQFRGLRGQSYQVHGIDKAVYNIITDDDTQLNSRFVFLNGPSVCPIIPSTGLKATACWTHSGSYLGEIGLKYKTTRIFINTGNAASGFSNVTINEKNVVVGQTTDILTYNSTHEVLLHFGPWTIELENIDYFLNLKSVKLDSSARKQVKTHGLLGQTWSNKRYASKLAVIEGDVDDYLIADDDIFGDSFVYNKYDM